MTNPIDLAQTSPPTTTIKLLCSYGGKIVPRHPDGKLRYNGGHTRVLAVNRSVSFAELLVKLGEMNGASVSLRCQLPNEDMDALVSITSNEDLANLIEEYEHKKKLDDKTASSDLSLKIKAFLYPPKSFKRVSPTPSVAAFSSNNSKKLPQKSTNRPYFHMNSQLGSRIFYEKALGKLSGYAYHGSVYPGHGHVFLVHHENQW